MSLAQLAIAKKGESNLTMLDAKPWIDDEENTVRIANRLPFRNRHEISNRQVGCTGELDDIMLCNVTPSVINKSGNNQTVLVMQAIPEAKDTRHDSIQTSIIAWIHDYGVDWSDLCTKHHRSVRNRQYQTVEPSILYDMAKATQELNEVTDDAGEDSHAIPLGVTFANAKSLMNKIYSIAPRHFIVCPMSDSHIDIDTRGQSIRMFRHLCRQFQQIIRESKGEAFFDGMNSPLAEKTERIIATNGEIAVEALQQTLNKHQNEIESVEEILRQVGLLQDKQTYRHRLNLLTAMLSSRQARIRDAASLGLSFMEDPEALSALYAAQQAETVDWVRKNLSLVIDQLERT